MNNLKAIVEIPRDSVYKYEYDQDNNCLVLDRLLNYKVPSNYGFIPNTLCDDGDPLDVFIISYKPLLPLTHVNIEIVGYVDAIDNGEHDPKIIAIIQGDNVKHYRYEGKLWPLEDIKAYLKVYKEGFKVKKFYGKREALRLIKKCTI